MPRIWLYPHQSTQPEYYASRLQEVRVRVDLTQGQLAQEARISVTTLSLLESRRRSCRQRTAERITQALRQRAQVQGSEPLPTLADLFGAGGADESPSSPATTEVPR